MQEPSQEFEARRRSVRFNPARIVLSVVLLVGLCAAYNLALTGQREHRIARHFQTLGGAVSFRQCVPDWVLIFAPGKAEFFDRIESVSFSGNPVVISDIIVELTSLRELESLELNDTRLTDSDLEQLSRLTCLKSLDVSNTNVTDAGLQHLKTLFRLQNLNLLSTAATDSSLQLLKSLSSLKSIDLENTNVTEQGKAAFRSALPGCTVMP